MGLGLEMSIQGFRVDSKADPAINKKPNWSIPLPKMLVLQCCTSSNGGNGSGSRGGSRHSSGNKSSNSLSNSNKNNRSKNSRKKK